MSDDPEAQVYLERIDPSRNMARFYALSAQPTLFGELSLIRRWGRIGTHGRDKIETFAGAAELAEAWQYIERQKRRRGYFGGRQPDGRP